MTLLVAPDAALCRTPDGKYWSKTIYSYDFFERYLAVFEDIVVVSRTKYVDYPDVAGYLRTDGPRMQIRELPDMHGMKDYIKKIVPFSKAAKAAVSGVDCAIIRLPSMPASMVLHYFKRKSNKFFLEVVVDPEDAYAPNFIAKNLFTRNLKKECREAAGVSYVTKYYLQNKYPSFTRLHGDDGKHFEEYYSTIRLKDNYFYKPRSFSNKETFNIIHTANNMTNSIKGHEILIRATQKVIESGYNITLTFVGDGVLRPNFERLAKKLNISENVRFTGMLSGSDAVREELVNADLLVFPTKAEGLPRTIIEAMATGLPCISTPVAGIPELLQQEDMLDPEDIDGFAKRIIEFISNPGLMEEKSKRNFEVAHEYSENVLSARRNSFYMKLKQLEINTNE